MREGWTYKKLGEVASVTDYVANGSFATLRENVHYLDSKGYAILIRYADYSNGFDPNKYVYIDKHAYNFLSKSKLYGGEIIMSNVGSIGKSFICPKLPMPMSLAPNSIVINTPNNRFYQYYFKSNSFQGLLKTISSKTALPKFNKTQFKGLVAPIPPFTEQERIVSELDLLSGIIDKKKEQLKAYDQLAQSIFYDMFGDPIENPKGWGKKKLGEIAKEKLSYGSGASAVQYDGKTRYIRITDIREDGELNKGMVSPDCYEEKYLLNEGDILFARSGATVGKTFQYKGKHGKCIYAGYLIRLVPNTNIVLPSYIFGFTKSSYYRSFVAKAQNAVAQPNINAKQYGDLIITVPPLSLQQSFAEKVEAIEKAKKLIRRTMIGTIMLFNYTMDKYFG